MKWNDGSRWHLASTSLLGAQSVEAYAIEQNNAVVADAAAHSLAREPLRDAAKVKKTVGTAKHVHVSCAEDAAMNEGKQSLQRDVIGSRCLEGVCGMNMLDVCQRTSAGGSDPSCVVFARVARTTVRGPLVRISRRTRRRKANQTLLSIIMKTDRLGNVGVEDWRVAKDVDNVLEDNLFNGKNTMALGAVLNHAQAAREST